MNPVILSLLQAVANTYVLTALTQSAHWNVRGSDFFQLHEVLGTQYEDLFDTIDLLAERVRALDALVPVSLSSFDAQAKMPSFEATADARNMIAILLQAHDKNILDLKSLALTAKDNRDPVTENMVLSLIEAEQKKVWMLKSYLK